MIDQLQLNRGSFEGLGTHWVQSHPSLLHLWRHTTQVVAAVLRFAGTGVLAAPAAQRYCKPSITDIYFLFRRAVIYHSYYIGSIIPASDAISFTSSCTSLCNPRNRPAVACAKRSNELITSPAEAPLGSLTKVLLSARIARMYFYDVDGNGERIFLLRMQTDLLSTDPECRYDKYGQVHRGKAVGAPHGKAWIESRIKCCFIVLSRPSISAPPCSKDMSQHERSSSFHGAQSLRTPPCLTI